MMSKCLKDLKGLKFVYIFKISFEFRQKNIIVWIRSKVRTVFLQTYQGWRYVALIEKYKLFKLIQMPYPCPSVPPSQKHCHLKYSRFE